MKYPPIDHNATIKLAEMVLAFGRVDRITKHPDGVTPESDTDHTVMLGMMACAAAEIVNQWPHFGRNKLDLGLIAQFALVHDFPEVYAGDTPTLRHQRDSAKAAKAEREHAAIVQIASETEDLPWVSDTLQRYEDQEVREARFVRAMDKLLPKMLALLNDGASIVEQGVSRRYLRDRYAEQREEIESYAGEFTALMDLRDDLVAEVLEMMREQGL